MHTAAQASAPEDYDAILAAVSETPRGRWFLAEYASRNRTADTSLVLGEISRLEHLLALQNPQLAANRTNAAIQDLATVLALAPDGQGDTQTEGLTPQLVATLAFAIGQSGETIRDALLTARGAALSMREHQHEPQRAARFQEALDRQIRLIDEQAGIVAHSASRVEALAHVIAQLRERLRLVLQTGAVKPESSVAPPAIAVEKNPPPTIAPAALQPVAPPVSSAPSQPLEKDAAGVEEIPAFEQVWHVPPVPAHAKLRHVAALMQDGEAAYDSDADAILEDSPLIALAQSARTAHASRTLAELDRLSYTERAALFA